MKLLIDDTNLELIKKLCDIFPIDGITSNPSILSKTEGPPYQTLKAIRDYIGDKLELHVQVVSKTADEMIGEAHTIQNVLGDRTFIKIPVTNEGLKAIKRLGNEGANITATAIYTSMQGYLAGKAGAHYAAPYVNRIDNLGANGVQVAKDIHDIFKNNNLKTEVLAASFKNSQQVLELVKYGIGAATISPDVMKGLINLDAVSCAVDAFVKDFEKLCGTGKTMLDC